MDCKHTHYTSVNQYSNAEVFQLNGTGSEILEVLDKFPSSICIARDNIKESSAKAHLTQYPYDNCFVYVIFSEDSSNATLFKLRYCT